jgi:hypothetical protein
MATLFINTAIDVHQTEKKDLSSYIKLVSRVKTAPLYKAGNRK